MSLLLALFVHAEAATLEQAWDAVEARSHEALMAAAQREQSDLAPFRVAGALLPRVSVGAGVTFNQIEVAFDPANMFPPEVTDLIEQLTGEPLPTGDPIVIERKTAFDGNLTLLMPLVLPSAFAQAAGVNDAVLAGRANEDAALSQLRAGVSELYWAVLLSRDAERLARGSLDNAKAHAALVDVQLAAGVVPPQAQLQAALATSRAQREVQAASARRAVAERALAAMTGFTPDEPLVTPTTPRVPWTSLEEATAHALAHRPELVAAEANVDFSRTQRLATQLGWVPTIQGRFTEAYTQNTGFAGRNWLWNAGIQLNWSLWDGGWRVADSIAARSQLHLAQEAMAKLQEDTRTSVLQAWEEERRAKLALMAVEQEVELARENLRIAELALSTGTVPFQDVEDARLGLLMAELGRLQEQRAVHMAVIQLLLVTGEIR